MPLTPNLATQIGRGGEKIQLRWRVARSDGGVDDDDDDASTSSFGTAPQGDFKRVGKNARPSTHPRTFQTKDEASRTQFDLVRQQTKRSQRSWLRIL